MHSNDEYDDEERGQRARRGAAGMWFGPPWAGPGAAEGPGEGPGPGWRGGPWPWFTVKGWGHYGGGRPWGRARRGDVRSAVLALLAERPMHGYEIIGELTERTEGLWRPSPGSVYPTLQLLEDEGLVIAEADSTTGKKRYALTDQGRTAAADMARGPAPWEQVAAGAPAGAKALRHAMANLMPAIGQVLTSGSGRQQEEAVKVLEEARRRLYSILAGDQAAG